MSSIIRKLLPKSHFSSGVFQGNDRGSRPGWRRRGQPGRVSSHHEENLSVLKEVGDFRGWPCRLQGTSCSHVLLENLIYRVVPHMVKINQTTFLPEIKCQIALILSLTFHLPMQSVLFGMLQTFYEEYKSMFMIPGSLFILQNFTVPENCVSSPLQVFCFPLMFLGHR